MASGRPVAQERLRHCVSVSMCILLNHCSVHSVNYCELLRLRSGSLNITGLNKCSFPVPFTTFLKRQYFLFSSFFSPFLANKSGRDRNLPCCELFSVASL